MQSPVSIPAAVWHQEVSFSPALDEFAPGLALAAGAGWLGVVQTRDALALRRAGITAPVLCLLAAPDAAHEEAIAAGIDLSAGSAGLVGQPYETLIDEYMNLPLKDTVKEKWLYKNAARVFELA